MFPFSSLLRHTLRSPDPPDNADGQELATTAWARRVLGGGSVVTLSRDTIDATLSALTTDGLTPTLLNRLVVPDGAAWMMTFLLSAVQTGGTAGSVGDAAEWAGWVAVKRVGSTMTLSRIWALGADFTSYAANAGIPPFNPGGASAEAASAAWRASFALDAPNNLFLPRVTGEADKTIQWRGTYCIAGRLS